MITIPNASVILAIETCTTICSVALWDGKRQHTRVVEAARSHSKELLPMIESVIRAAHLTVDDIDYIACARGPGSFTGLRIGIGVAKGLAYGQDIPIVPVSPLLALAYGIMKSAPVVQSVTALLDARMGEVYAAHYDIVEGFPVLQGHEILTTADRLDGVNRLWGGTGVREYQNVLEKKGFVLSEVLYPLAADLVEIVQRGEIESVSAAEFSPVYLRDKVTD